MEKNRTPLAYCETPNLMALFGWQARRFPMISLSPTELCFHLTFFSGSRGVGRRRGFDQVTSCTKFFSSAPCFVIYKQKQQRERIGEEITAQVEFWSLFSKKPIFWQVLGGKNLKWLFWLQMGGKNNQADLVLFLLRTRNGISVEEGNFNWSEFTSYAEFWKYVNICTCAHTGMCVCTERLLKWNGYECVRLNYINEKNKSWN